MTESKVADQANQKQTVCEGFDHTSFEELYELEAGNFWFRARNALILWILKKQFANAQSFLEIGCGTGYVLSAVAQKFPATDVAGSDLFEEGLRFAQTRVPRARLEKLDARNLRLENAFTVVGMFDVLEHIPEDLPVLAEVFAALKPGGGILLTVPQHQFLYSYGDRYGGHVRRYTRRDLVDKLHAAGFTVRYATSFVSLLFPLLIVSRLLNRHPPKNFDPLAELRQSSRLNIIMEPIMALERLLLRAGVNFPFGGSLLVVATKPDCR